MQVISKEEFIDCIEEVKKVYDYQDSINKFFQSHGAEGSIYEPECATTTLKLLHMMFEESDVDMWIEKFCFDYKYGEKYSGEIRDIDGNPVDLYSIETLYDELVKRLPTKEVV